VPPPPPPAAAPATAPTAIAVAHVIGTKFVDYCSDGTKVTPYPGDPAIDANLNKPDAATPKCPSGLQWHHTSGMDKYDTPSGDLDVNTYAQQADGSYIVHYAASIYTDATSTASWPDRIVSTKTSPVAQQPAQVSTESTSASASDSSVPESTTPASTSTQQ
jgi:hypothetical protein